MLNKIKNTACFIRSKVDFHPEIGIILGTGLGRLADHIDIKCVIDYSAIPDFPTSTVSGHQGRLILGTLAGRRVIAMQGRFHYYEGYTAQQITFPVRVMKELGIETLIVSNASGGVNLDFAQGDLMIIHDHVNFIPNPLIGANTDELGDRFPDMSTPYDPRFIALAERMAGDMGLKLRKGCYVGFTGPSLETPGEYRFARTIGGDAVGMSTTPEVIVARHMKLPVFGVSVITNIGGAGIVGSHEENQREGAKAELKLTQLIINMLPNM